MPVGPEIDIAGMCASALFKRLQAADHPEVLLDCLMNPEKFIDATDIEAARELLKGYGYKIYKEHWDYYLGRAVLGKSISRLASGELGRIKDGRTVVPLIACMVNDKCATYVRANAAAALGRIGDARAVEPLIARLNDQETDVRRDAVFALGDIGDTRAVEPLIACLKDQETGVRRDAAEALKSIRSRLK